MKNRNGDATPTVAVLLSAFRGGDFIVEQVASILAQRDVDVRLVIRDDGSGDGSEKILHSLAESDARVRLIRGDHVGVVASFFALLSVREALDAGFIAFADQDDIWPDERLARQCAALNALPVGMPGLCFGAFLPVNRSGVALGPPVRPPLPDKGALLSENQIPGCTLLLNRAGHDLILRSLPPAAHVFMHDWWVEQVIAFTGQVVRIDDVVLHYRQHGGNLVGAPGFVGMWRDRLKRIPRLRGRHPLAAQIAELEECLGPLMMAEDRLRVARFRRALQGSLVERLPLVLAGDFSRARRSDDLFLRLLLLTGYFRSYPR